MRVLVWCLRVALFVLFFGFAILNTERVALDLFVTTWHAPLALVLLMFFLAGALLGVAVLVPVLIRQRQTLRRTLRQAPLPASAPSAPTQPPRV